MSEGTVTGRIRSSPEFNQRIVFNRGLSKSLIINELLEYFLTITAIDYSHLEDRIAAMMIKRNEDGTLDYKVIELDSYIQGYNPQLVIMDDYLPTPVELVREKPTKQNGRCAAYLDLDPTKKHKVRKKK